MAALPSRIFRVIGGNGGRESKSLRIPTTWHGYELHWKREQFRLFWAEDNSMVGTSWRLATLSQVCLSFCFLASGPCLWFPDRLFTYMKLVAELCYMEEAVETSVALITVSYSSSKFPGSRNLPLGLSYHMWCLGLISWLLPLVSLGFAERNLNLGRNLPTLEKFLEELMGLSHLEKQ